jgi:hypothetical protein
MSTRWTYKVVDVKATFLEVKANAVQETLNQLGLQGWELVTAQQIGTSARLYLKKEI